MKLLFQGRLRRIEPGGGGGAENHIVPQMRTHHGWIRRERRFFEIQTSRMVKNASPRLKFNKLMCCSN